MHKGTQLNKSEALAVMHEIYDAVKDTVSVSCVSLDGSQVSHISTGGYQIKMKCELDSHSIGFIDGILKKNNLAMKKQNGYIIIHSVTD